jgi:hypothetical protein
MVYVDTPSPSVVYLLTLLAFGALVAGAFVFVYVVLARRTARTAAATFTVVIGLLPTALVVLIVVAAFTVRYEISDMSLAVRAGLFHDEFALRTIERAEPAGGIARTLGGGLNGRGFANRLTDGVRLRVDGRWVYLGPSDVDTFLAALADRGVPVTPSR